jgi:8-oxo-dGTP pyrophosphatase MutT (NUDIX family)
MSRPTTDMTATRIRQRFASTRMPEDPLAVAIPTADWAKAFHDKLAGELLAAAVLIPIVCRDARLSVLLTERSPHLKHHAGQISFPGGRMDPEDVNIGATALRETWEEVGIQEQDIEVVGYLEPNPTVTGYAVTPVVALVELRNELTIDPLEVSSAFEVPLEFLLDEGNQSHSMRAFEGIEMPMVEFKFDRHRIWGATAAMLIEFRRFLLK